MRIKNQGSKDDQPNKSQAKELQKFLHKVKGVMLVPKGNEIQAEGLATLFLILHKEDFISFKDYGINKVVTNLLDDKYPLLGIKIEDTRTTVGLSIIDKDSNLQFKFPDQPMGDALLKFLGATKYDDKIPIMLGCYEGDNLLFEKNIMDNVLLVLNGYFFE